MLEAASFFFFLNRFRKYVTFSAGLFGNVLSVYFVLFRVA